MLLPLHGPLDGAVLCCAAGTRSASARQVLAEHGIAVRSLRGGYGAVRERAAELGLRITGPEGPGNRPD